jgi:hypothetical protein
MKMKPIEDISHARDGERGAALVTSLLISTLLLVASSALLLKTTNSVSVSFGSTAEMQAYYSAEAGLQSALNVLRGNVQNADADLADLRSALDMNGGNLHAWLAYDKTVNGTQAKSLGPNAYSVAVTLPPGVADTGGDPDSVLVTSTGYGPRGSVKQITMLVNRSSFDFSAKSTLLMRGADDCSNIDTFSIGQSNAKEYSGNDAAGAEAPLPVVGTTCAGNQTQATSTVNSSKPNTVTGNAEKVANIDKADLMSWLQSASSARALLLEMAATASASDRYFTSTPSDFGSDTSPQLTFVDGDCDLRSGTGLLIVTGTLSMSGNASFDGIILVLGEGAMTRNGGGNGDILGAIVVAKFDRTWPADENDEPHPFLAPTFQTNGGGNSTVQYDSVKIKNAIKLLGVRVFGVQEN